MKKKQKHQELSTKYILELLEDEIDSYNIREAGSMEKKMALVKFKKELQKKMNEFENLKENK